MTNSFNRRKFLRGSAVAGAAALATPAIAESHGTTLKMQAAWGGGIFLENAQSYVKRVNEMAGGSLKIDLLPVNSVVKTSQMQDAVHRGVLDAAHYVPAYWYSKSKSASLFGTGPCFGWSIQEVLGWVYDGGGQELFDELMASVAPERCVVLQLANACSAAWLVQESNHRRSPNEGPEVPHRWSWRRRSAGNGHVGCSASRRRNSAGHEIRPDRRGRIQQPDV